MIQSTNLSWFLPTIFNVVRIVISGTLFSATILAKADDNPSNPAASQKAVHLERMRKLAKEIRVFEVSSDKRLQSDILDQPVLAYRDDTRRQDDSTMWIWGTPGRPTAMLAVEYYPQNPIEKRWLFEIASLSAGQIAAEKGKELNWKSRQPGLNFQPVMDATPPAEKAAARLAQMRQLRSRITAYEFDATDGRIQLQPLTTPLHRYQDPDRGIIDGAVFAFASGTNPEVLWIVEAFSNAGAAPVWQFGLAQMTGGEVFVQFDEKEIWKRGAAVPPSTRESYINGWMSEKEEKPK